MNSKQLKKLIRQYRRSEKRNMPYTVSLMINIKSSYISTKSDVGAFYRTVSKGIGERFNTSPAHLLAERPWRFRIFLRDMFSSEVCDKQQG